MSDCFPGPVWTAGPWWHRGTAMSGRGIPRSEPGDNARGAGHEPGGNPQ